MKAKKTKPFLKKGATFFIILLSVFTLTSCSFFYKDPVVLQINSKKWTSRQFAKRLAQKIQKLPIQDLKKPKFLENIKTQLIGDLLLESMVYELSKQHLLVVSSQELNQAIQKMKNNYQSDAIFSAHLKSRKINNKAFKQGVKRRLLYEKVQQKIITQVTKPSQKELKQYYKSNLKLFKKAPAVFAHHIYHKKKELIEKVRTALKSGDKWPIIAKKFNLDSALITPKWIEKSTLPKGLIKPLDFKKNKISPVWQSGHTYHLIYVLKTRPKSTLSYKEALPRIQKTLMEQRQKAIFIKWLSQQSQKAQVFKDELAIKSIKIKLN